MFSLIQITGALNILILIPRAFRLLSETLLNSIDIELIFEGPAEYKKISLSPSGSKESAVPIALKKIW